MELGPNWYEIGSKTYPGEPNGFHSGEEMEHEKVLWVTMVGAKKGFSILDVLEWLKLFLFFLCFSFFFLPHKNIGAHTPRPRPPSGVAGPDYIPKGPYEIKF